MPKKIRNKAKPDNYLKLLHLRLITVVHQKENKKKPWIYHVNREKKFVFPLSFFSNCLLFISLDCRWLLVVSHHTNHSTPSGWLISIHICEWLFSRFPFHFRSLPRYYSNECQKQKLKVVTMLYYISNFLRHPNLERAEPTETEFSCLLKNWYACIRLAHIHFEEKQDLENQSR